jgi:tRNA threonylcarbamoyladenosine biosynthesis protein TsaB
MLLGLDTATDRASIALALPGSAPMEETIGGSRRHAAGLLPAIQALLRRAGASIDDLTGIALSDGPGSFTGLRVGASVAKALIQTRGLPLWIAPSLMVRAAGSARDGEIVLAVANALRGEVYAAAYRFLSDRIVVELAPSVRRPDDLTAGPLRPGVIVGDVPAEIAAPLEAWSGRALIAPPDGFPQARSLIALVGRAGGATRVERVAEWEPVYGRPAEAQTRWEIAHGRPLPDPVGNSS